MFLNTSTLRLLHSQILVSKVLKNRGLYNLEPECSRRESRWPISRLCDREERLRRWIVIAHRCAKSQRKSRIGTYNTYSLPGNISQYLCINWKFVDLSFGASKVYQNEPNRYVFHDNLGNPQSDRHSLWFGLCNIATAARVALLLQQ